MRENKILDAMRRDPVLSAVMWAFMVVTLREKGERVEAPQFTAAELREAVDRVEYNMERLLEDESTASVACVTLAQLREQLEAVTDNA